MNQVEARQHTCIFIYTGFTAGICQSNICAWSSRFALSEEEFTSIWNRKLKLIENMQDYRDYYDAKSLRRTRDNCQSVFRSLQDFAITPGLTHFAFNVIMDKSDHKGGNVVITYLNKLKEEVDNFPSIDNDNEEDIKALVEETSLIAEVIKRGGVIPLESFRSERCPVNVFTYDIGTATREDCESIPAFLVHELLEGQLYVKLSFVQKCSSQVDRWLNKLTLTAKQILNFDLETSQRYTTILGKLVEGRLVESQLKKKVFFLPYSHLPTSYKERTTSNKINHGWVKILPLSPEDVTATEADFSGLTVPTKYKGQLKIVALHTKHLMNKIFRNKERSKLMYPGFSNFCGVDYFLYIPSEDVLSSDPSVSKKRKSNPVLILFQVTLNKTHGTKRVAAALDCVNEVIATELHENGNPLTLDVHVCFLILHNKPLSLRDCIQFNEASCISVASERLLQNMTNECCFLVDAVMRKDL